MKDVYLHLEDEYDSTLRIDEKHCNEDELRIMIDGHEFYLSPADRLKVIQTLAFSLDSE